MPVKSLKNDLLIKLARAVSKYPRIEKILIDPDRATGNHILQNLARTGTPWINFNVQTVTVESTQFGFLADSTLITKIRTFEVLMYEMPMRERLERIGQLLTKAIYLTIRKEQSID